MKQKIIGLGAVLALAAGSCSWLLGRMNRPAPNANIDAELTEGQVQSSSTDLADSALVSSQDSLSSDADAAGGAAPLAPEQKRAPAAVFPVAAPYHPRRPCSDGETEDDERGPSDAVVCEGVERCSVSWNGRWPAGHDANCSPLWIVRRDQAAEKPAAEDEDSACGQPCNEQTFVLYGAPAPGSGSKVPEPVEVLYLCNDGYGASCVGDDSVAVGDNRFYHARSGGSNWRWGQERMVRLSPPTLLAEGESGFVSSAGHHYERKFSWEFFEGTGSFSSTSCEVGERKASGAEWALIPHLATHTPAEQLLESAGLGDCALQLTGQSDLEEADPRTPWERGAARGYFWDGAQPSEQAARLKILALNSADYLIEIYDPLPYVSERLTIARSKDEVPGPFEYCASQAHPVLLTQLTGLHQAGVPLQQGAPLTVKARRFSDHQTLLVHIDKPETGIAFWYDDHDEEDSVARTLSTVRERPSDEASLGDSFSVGEGACVLQDGELIAARGKSIQFPLTD